MIAVGEKLCNLDANEESRRLDSNNTCVFIEPPIHWDEMPEEYASTASQIVIILFLRILLGFKEAKYIEFCICGNHSDLNIHSDLLCFLTLEDVE